MSASPAGNALLLCLDLQPVFLNAMANPGRVLRRCAFAIEAGRGLGLPVVFTEQVPQKLGGTVPALLALAPGAAVWGKTAFSALADDGIRDALRKRAIPHLIICGLETPVCVYQTARMGQASGYDVTVLSDAVSARRTDDAETVLAALRHAGVNVLPAESVFYALLRDTAHPFFRAYTQLVKKYA